MPFLSAERRSSTGKNTDLGGSVLTEITCRYSAAGLAIYTPCDAPHALRQQNHFGSCTEHSSQGFVMYAQSADMVRLVEA